MNFWTRLARDENGGPAAEFALVLPLILLFLFGIIDVGRFMWEVNKAEKATQTGARWAAVTQMIPTDLASYSFATSASIPAGTPVPATAFPGVSCSGTTSTTTCQCVAGGTCAFGMTASQPAFGLLVDRMDDIMPAIKANNVLISYSHSGLGFAGDPNGPDVAPIITVSLTNMEFEPLTFFVFGGDIDLPDFSYSLTMEDGAGDQSN